MKVNANANVFVPVEWVVKFVIFAFNGQNSHVLVFLVARELFEYFRCSVS